MKRRENSVWMPYEEYIAHKKKGWKVHNRTNETISGI